MTVVVDNVGQEEDKENEINLLMEQVRETKRMGTNKRPRVALMPHDNNASSNHSQKRQKMYNRCVRERGGDETAGWLHFRESLAKKRKGRREKRKGRILVSWPTLLGIIDGDGTVSVLEAKLYCVGWWTDCIGWMQVPLETTKGTLDTNVTTAAVASGATAAVASGAAAVASGATAAVASGATAEQAPPPPEPLEDDEEVTQEEFMEFNVAQARSLESHLVEQFMLDASACTSFEVAAAAATEETAAQTAAKRDAATQENGVEGPH